MSLPNSVFQFALDVHGGMHGTFCYSLSEELHREVCQKLTAAKLELDILALDSEDDSLSRAREALSDSIIGIRELMDTLAKESLIGSGKLE